jgi:hypothetical protein
MDNVSTLNVAPPTRTNNYFKTVDDRIFFFDCTQVASIQQAWDGAQATGKRFSCFTPFSMAGPWFGHNLIGFMHVPVGSRRNNVELDEGTEFEMRLMVLNAWNATRNLRAVV